ncbi:MAG: hypothetical protein KJ737_05015 [Proteobacteria bacterium]|nr:hypothetical protein [Pseudomonadota bacterium]
MKIRMAIKIAVVATLMANIITAAHCFAGSLRDESWAENTCSNGLDGRLHDKISLNYYIENNFEYANATICNHVEYDFTDSITMFNTICYKYIRSEYSYSVYDEYSADGSNKTNVMTGDAYGLDDIDVGLKQRLLDSDYGIFTHKIKVSIPGPYDENETLPLGSGKYNIDYSILYGYSLQRIYLNLETGYRWRSGGLSGQINYSAGIVARITCAIRARVKVHGRSYLNNGEEGDTTSGVTTSTEMINRNSVNRACGGDGGGFTSDTTLNDSTDDRFSDLILNLGLMIKLTDNIGLNCNYRPSIHIRNMSEDTSLSVGIFYWFI